MNKLRRVVLISACFALFGIGLFPPSRGWGIDFPRLFANVLAVAAGAGAFLLIATDSLARKLRAAAVRVWLFGRGDWFPVVLLMTILLVALLFWLLLEPRGPIRWPR